LLYLRIVLKSVSINLQSYDIKGDGFLFYGPANRGKHKTDAKNGVAGAGKMVEITMKPA